MTAIDKFRERVRIAQSAGGVPGVGAFVVLTADEGAALLAEVDPHFSVIAGKLPDGTRVEVCAYEPPYAAVES